MWIDGIYQRFSLISTRILLGQISPGSAETDIGQDGNLNNYVIARCVINIYAKNY